VYNNSKAEAERCLITVGGGLVGSSLGDTDVVGLLGGQQSQSCSELVEVKTRDLLIEELGQHVHLLLVLAGRTFDVELHLSHNLVGESCKT